MAMTTTDPTNGATGPVLSTQVATEGAAA